MVCKPDTVFRRRAADQETHKKRVDKYAHVQSKLATEGSLRSALNGHAGYGIYGSYVGDDAVREAHDKARLERSERKADKERDKMERRVSGLRVTDSSRVQEISQISLITGEISLKVSPFSFVCVCVCVRICACILCCMSVSIPIADQRRVHVDLESEHQLVRVHQGPEQKTSLVSVDQGAERLYLRVHHGLECSYVRANQSTEQSWIRKPNISMCVRIGSS